MFVSSTRGRYVYRSLGVAADDYAEADGRNVLDFLQAVKRGEEVAPRGARRRPSASRPRTTR